jgi:hypothetical protein
MIEKELDLEQRLRRIEYALMNLSFYSRSPGSQVPIGICSDARCGYPYHPHWETPEHGYAIDWNVPIVHSGRLDK